MAYGLPDEDQFAGEEVLDKWILQEEVGRGNNGVVYRAENKDFGHLAACKLIPNENLKPGWENEIDKCERLFGHKNVVQFKNYGAVDLDFDLYVCIVSEYVEGPDLAEFIEESSEQITLALVETVISDILEVMYAMEQLDITHGDLHAGNVLLSESDLYMGDDRVVKVSDFGIGGSQNHLKPKNDYAQLADITHQLLESIDVEELDSLDRFFYDFLIEDFLDKRILEENPTKGDFVKSPELLNDILSEGRQEARRRLDDKRNVELKNPFDYLSCEQMGDSFQLIEQLYSNNFPGYNQILGRTHTILTGPRGCGKTTILKNMALETKIESESIESTNDIDFIGVYYHCRDLYFAFHYLDDNPTDEERQLLLHYFSLSLAKEFLSTLEKLREDIDLRIPKEAVENFEDKLSKWLDGYTSPPEGIDLLNHLDSVLTQQKNKVGEGLRTDPSKKPDSTVPVNFLAEECISLISETNLDSNIPIFFLIDDYSKPKISEAMQSTLNDLIMERWDQVYFKCSTESITTFHHFDSQGKLLEETREYEVIDLASHFIGETERRGKFISEVINSRLENTAGIHEKYTDITDILGERTYDSYNDLARKIRSGDKVTYSGFETIRDLFSGDISEILRIIRGIFEERKPDHDWSDDSIDLPISKERQDRQIRAYGGSFLNKIESAPDRGSRLRQIADVFGRRAHQRLLNEDSKNQSGSPPFQAFRIEIRDSLIFEPNDDFKEVAKRLEDGSSDLVEDNELEDLVEETKEVYDDLLRYGVFLMDTRGKSIRGGVVNRFYLRRLLLPKYNLTPSQRDNIDLEPSEFLFLLKSPDEFNNVRFEDSLLSDYSEEESDS